MMEVANPNDGGGASTSGGSVLLGEAQWQMAAAADLERLQVSACCGVSTRFAGSTPAGSACPIPVQPRTVHRLGFEKQPAGFSPLYAGVSQKTSGTWRTRV